MAYIVKRTNGSGDVTSYQVKWRADGRRDGAQQTERFEGDAAGKAAAEVFRDAVNDAGQQWPPGWVKGEGYILAAVVEPDDSRYRFDRYALAMFDNKTGIQEQYRKDCIRDLKRYVFPTFENCDVRSVEHFCGDTVTAWVRRLEQTMVHKGRAPKEGPAKLHPMSPKTIRNLHGLLSAVLEKAVKSEPPLRDRNPCALTTLPRTDDDGADGGEDIEFLTPDEVDGLISCMERRTDQPFSLVRRRLPRTQKECPEPDLNLFRPPIKPQAHRTFCSTVADGCAPVPQTARMDLVKAKTRMVGPRSRPRQEADPAKVVASAAAHLSASRLCRS